MICIFYTMGIKGLLKFASEAIENININQCQGSTIAVDTYGWIYKGAFSCSQLDLNNELATHNKIKNYVLAKVDFLIKKNIKLVMVFDGCKLPIKATTLSKRRA
jgi:exonuclease-1